MSVSARRLQTWISSPRFDWAWVIGPHFYAVILALALYPMVKDADVMPVWVWFVLVLCIDVAHVYSTLFRVYLDKNESQRFPTILWLIPFTVWFLGVLLYSVSPLSFWRFLAYLAVFHFIRQQYGFFRIYAGQELFSFSWQRYINQYAIYFVTVIPVLIWHASGPKDFNWFISHDFIYFQSSTLVFILNTILVIAIAAYICTEIQRTKRAGFINWPKNGIYLGTLLIWYLGIVQFNNDIIFTLTNVVAHGIPYLALIWVYKRHNKTSYQLAVFRRPNIVIFILCLVGLAYIEEFLWAVLVWKEHLSVFFLNRNQVFETSVQWLTYLVPLLAVPQGTHYVLDAFIWKIHNSKTNQWTRIINRSDLERVNF
ncbi:MAG: hypothetical protein JNL11_00045 [Bdellovibrionaceae bacterium]|nr:hypothetical protein [Pseudobdellovibrionaceae bacterium]